MENFGNFCKILRTISLDLAVVTLSSAAHFGLRSSFNLKFVRLVTARASGTFVRQICAISRPASHLLHFVHYAKRHKPFMFNIIFRIPCIYLLKRKMCIQTVVADTVVAAAAVASRYRSLLPPPPNTRFTFLRRTRVYANRPPAPRRPLATHPHCLKFKKKSTVYHDDQKDHVAHGLFSFLMETQSNIEIFPLYNFNFSFITGMYTSDSTRRKNAATFIYNWNMVEFSRRLYTIESRTGSSCGAAHSGFTCQNIKHSKIQLNDVFSGIFLRMPGDGRGIIIFIIML